jgi:hypothetical protein
LLLFVVIGGGLFGIVVVRRKLSEDDAGVRELPPDVLIAIARSRDAELTSRESGDRGRRDADESAPRRPPFKDA